MKDLINISALLVLTSFCLAQDYKATFDKYCQDGDTLKQKEILTKWEKEDPKNAELYTSYFNYFFFKSRKELLSLTKDQPTGKSFSFQDSTGQTAGYLGSKIGFDRTTLQKGLDKIDEGIKLYPDRLDMRFGKIYVLGQVPDWENFTEEIVRAIQYSAINNSEWTWTNNVRKVDGEKFFLSSIQDYQVNLYDTGDDRLLNNMRTIANEILKLHPDHVESLSNLSITFLLTGEYDSAIEVLLKAEKIVPTDAIVLGNIAQGYKLKGDKKKAIEYYEKTVKYADKEMVEFAKQQIKELKK